MPLMVSISGIRGIFGDGLDPKVLVSFASAYGTWCRKRAEDIGHDPCIVIGRDARVTGDVCSRIVMATLQSVGCDVIDAGLATTPTVEMAVLFEKAVGGIVLSASHNPAQWNALKLLNEKGEFLSAAQGQMVLDLMDTEAANAVAYDQIGAYRKQDYLDAHIDAILALPYIHPEQIAAQNFKVAVDGINSVGGVAIPVLLERLGVAPENIIRLHCEPTGIFAHNPEPLPAHLNEIMETVRETGADLGIVVDPDADRLALVENGGRFFGEELTQVIAADFMWRFRSGAFVTNLSSSRTIEDVAARYGQDVHRSAVGEVNVVGRMKAVDAVLGGEGNGGVILPDLHYGRDGLIGVAMVLQHLADTGQALSDFRTAFPSYVISKNKIPLGTLNADAVLRQMAETYKAERISTVDGVKVDFEDGWVHLRKSNTEPIIRIYAEGRSEAEAEALAGRFMEEIQALGGLND